MPRKKTETEITPEVLEKIDKKLSYGRTRPPRVDHELQTQPGDNSEMLRKNLAIYKLPPVDRHDVAQVQARIIEYFEICEQYDMKPTIAALAMAFKIERQTLWRIVSGAEGYDKTYSQEVRDSIKTAYQLINTMYEDWMSNGKINPASGCFLMKNNFGYKDQTDLQIAPKPAEEQHSADDIARRYITE